MNKNSSALRQFFDNITGSGTAEVLSEFLFLTLGLLGLIFLAGGVPGLTIPLLPMAIAATLLMGLLFLVYYKAYRYFYIGLAGLMVPCLAWVVFNISALTSEISGLFDWTLKTSEADVFTLHMTAIPAVLLLALIFFLIEVPLRAHILLFACMTAALAAAAAAGVHFNQAALVLLGMWAFAFWSMSDRWRTVLLFLPVLLIASGLVFISGDGLYDAINHMDGSLRQRLEALLPELDSTDSGRVNRGNNNQAEGSSFSLTLDERPGTGIYLYDHHGIVYRDSRWILAASDFDKVIDGLYYKVIEANSDAVPTALTLEYPDKVLTLSPYLDDAEDSDSGRTQVKHAFSFTDLTGKWASKDAFAAQVRSQKAYLDSVRELTTAVPKKQLPQLTQLVRANPINSSDLDQITAFILHTLQSRTEYTLTPGLAPAGKDIVEYFLFDSGKGYCQQYASAAVLMYRLYGIPARYATGYWVVPDDFVTNSDGSVTASANGKQGHAWPEIFMEGFGWVPVEVTSISADGKELIHPGLTVERLHEIFREHGWEDQELTERQSSQNTLSAMNKDSAAPQKPQSPTESQDKTAPSTEEDSQSNETETQETNADDGSAGDGADIKGQDQETQEETQPGDSSSETEPESSSSSDESDPEDTGSGIISSIIFVLLRLLLILLLLLILMVGGLYFYLTRQSDRFLKLDFLALYQKLTEMLKSQGRLPEGDLSDKDYPEKLHEGLATISEDDAKRMQQTVLSAAFGPEDAARSDLTWLRGLYINCAGALESHLKGYKKYAFRFKWAPVMIESESKKGTKIPGKKARGKASQSAKRQNKKRQT